MRPEQKVQAGIVALLKRYKAAGEPLWWFKVHGGPCQKAGVPDLCIVWHGVPVFVEVKAPGKEATALQVATMRAIRDAGGMTTTADSVAQVRAFLEVLKARRLTRGSKDLLAIGKENRRVVQVAGVSTEGIRRTGVVES